MFQSQVKQPTWKNLRLIFRDVCCWFNLPVLNKANFWQSKIRLLSFQEQQLISYAKPTATNNQGEGNPQRDWNLFWHAQTYILTARRRKLKTSSHTKRLNLHCTKLKNLKRIVKMPHVGSLSKLNRPLILFQSTGVVSHVNLPSQQAKSDAAPALTAVGEAGEKNSVFHCDHCQERAMKFVLQKLSSRNWHWEE